MKNEKVKIDILLTKNVDFLELLSRFELETVSREVNFAGALTDLGLKRASRVG